MIIEEVKIKVFFDILLCMKTSKFQQIKKYAYIIPHNSSNYNYSYLLVILFFNLY